MAAKTTAPVDEAKTALEQAQRARDQALAAMESFKDRILAGDDDVSAEDYSTAAGAVEHAELKVQAAALALQAAQDVARLQRLQDLKAEIIEQAGTPEEALKDWQDLAEIAGRIVARCHSRRANINRWRTQLHRDGVPRGRLSDPTDPAHVGLGWAEAGMGHGDTITVDGRRIQAIEPGMLIATAAFSGARAHGVTYLHLEQNRAILTDPADWFRTRY